VNILYNELNLPALAAIDVKLFSVTVGNLNSYCHYPPSLAITLSLLLTEFGDGCAAVKQSEPLQFCFCHSGIL